MASGKFRADIARLKFLVTGIHTELSTLQTAWAAISPRGAPIAIFRVSEKMYSWGFRRISLGFSLANLVIFGIEISPRLEIGPGLVLPHTVGSVLGAAKIGANAMIFQQVTLGAKVLDMGYSTHLRPTIGDNVTIGAGAKILGGIFIADNVTVGANSVVVSDVPPNCVVAGNPAKVVRFASSAETV